MRGNRGCGAVRVRALRSIPAHAGKPSKQAPRPFAVGVYPRPCGETLEELQAGKQKLGLSPPMRGNQQRVALKREYRGSIPAHAGKPCCPIRYQLMSEVYPRPCGETNDGVLVHATPRGLSPPMRGNLALHRVVLHCNGSIPAHAGKPRSRITGLWPVRVYPRPCGETWIPPPAPMRKWGLSPPMRGNPRWLPHFGQVARVYPRPCGETFVLPMPILVIGGLSPPMRGNQNESL